MDFLYKIGLSELIDLSPEKRLTEGAFLLTESENNLYSVDTKRYIIDSANTGSLEINLFDLVSFDKDKTLFVFILGKAIESPVIEKLACIKFQLEINDIVLGKLSQFNIFNVDEFDSNIKISNFDLNGFKKGELFIVVGSKK